MLTSVALAFLAGGAGAWVYQQFIHPELNRQRAQTGQTTAAAPEPEGGTIPTRLDSLTGRLDQLEARIDKLPRSSSLPDLEPINQKLSLVEDLSRKVQDQQTRFGAFPLKIDQNARKITSMMADLEGVKNEVSSLRTDVHSGKSAVAATGSDKPAAAGPAGAGPAQTAEDDLARGVEQYQKKQYKGASETFDRLTQTQPNDARVWYYAALSRGFATGDWKGETERLVKQGVDRERAGKPEKSKIDSAFTGLAADTGKDWLAFYRRSGATPSESRAR
jgi:TolA-binding protein